VDKDGVRPEARVARASGSEACAPHDDNENDAPDGRARRVSERVDCGRAGVRVKAHDEEVVLIERGGSVAALMV
jgi:hypothetical protein